MRTSNWPSGEDEMLLRAALLCGDESLQAWNSWKQTADLATMNYGVQRLLPMLYNNLYEYEIDHPLLEHARRMRRETWQQNQMMFAKASPVLELLHQEHIKLMILKGAALVRLGYYSHAGLRPMNDLDILIPREQVATALEVLRDHDWTCRYRSPEFFTERWISGSHGAEFENSAYNFDLDVHWYLQHDTCYEGADDGCWANSVPFDWHGIPVYGLHATEKLLHACAHAARPNPVAPIRWIADVAAILRSSEEIAWDRLVSQAQEWRLSYSTGRMFAYLIDVLDLPIPRTVLVELQNAKVSKLERFQFETNMRDPNPLIGNALDIGFRYLRHSRSQPLQKRLVGLVDYWADEVQLSGGRSKVPASVLSAIVNNLQDWHGSRAKS